ncbi:hypothetical protein VMCG_01472 [Cytospora schulzeri]|uniref:DUF7905 domain-containing protein n=1 Tax=Cytospora schulzeri TaxID=448051 RepID=A0A423X6F6_9PEZI|nr:hypothetical protein VMCG_01472 [Valsa malicola]
MDAGNNPQLLVEFYLSGLWAWRPESRNQIITSLKSLELEKAYFHFDNEVGWIQVRCQTADKKDVLKRFLEIQSEMESESKDQGVMQPNSFVGEPSPYLSVPDTMIELEVPTELHRFEEVVAWQDLQPQHRKFSVDFLMDGARKGIEEAHCARLNIDWPARVIYAGAPSKAAADAVKTKLTTLLRSRLLLRPRTRHIFFVEENASAPGWTVDVRIMQQINPALAPSTLLDPLDHILPDMYGTVFNDAYCLRLCYKDPFKGVTWSTFGPREQDVFRGQTPERISQLFGSIRATPKERHGENQADTPSTTIKQWIQELPKPRTDSTTVCDLTGEPPTATLDGLGEDDPVPLHRAPVVRRGGFDVTPADAARDQRSLLDDPIVQDSASDLQRALRPSRRSILVPHPDSMPKGQDPRPQLPATEGSEFDQHIKRFLQHLMHPMKAKYGAVRLRAEIGRFFMINVEKSGVARNKEKQPANGWEAEQLVDRLNKSEGNCRFTKIISYWGNDIDHLVNMKEDKQKIWSPTGQGSIFFDFYFRARTSAGTAAHFVLEVDGQKFSWNLREARSPYDPIVVHCLSRHWDFRLVASHDYTLDQNVHFGAFARALVDSLIVRSAVLKFQYEFDGPPSVTIDEVRVRQVRRFQTRDKKTFLDISRTIPTEVKDFPGTKYRAVRSLQADDRKKGVFNGWYEASVSSARMEGLLQQNEALVPGDEVEWTLEQLEKEGVFEDMYRPACQIVRRMDGVGVKCDNGMLPRELPMTPQSQFIYQY